MENKIIQIIPAPPGLYAVYEDDSSRVISRIVCLGLTSAGEILPLDMWLEDGCIHDPTTVSNFQCFEWR